MLPRRHPPSQCEGLPEIGRPVGHRILPGPALALLKQDGAVRVVNGDIVQVLERDERSRRSRQKVMAEAHRLKREAIILARRRMRGLLRGDVHFVT